MNQQDCYPPFTTHSSNTFVFDDLSILSLMYQQDCYLEATNERCRDLYLRHGFKVLEVYTIDRGAGPPVWLMKRTMDITSK